MYFKSSTHRYTMADHLVRTEIPRGNHMSIDTLENIADGYRNKKVLLYGREQIFGRGSGRYNVTAVSTGHPFEEVHAELTHATRETAWGI